MDYIFTCQLASKGLVKEEIESREDIHFRRWLDNIAGIVSIENQEYIDDPPIFLRHVFPILETVEKKSSVEELAIFCFTHLDFEQPFSLQIRGLMSERKKIRTLTQALRDYLVMSGYRYQPKQAFQVVSFYVTEEVVFCGYSTTLKNLSKWNGGQAHLSPKGTISRAELKLEEVFLEEKKLPVTGHALDLGAAPGGWTHFLLNKGFHVTAVDPAKMDKTVHTNKMKHYKMITQQFIREVPKKEYDLIVNDMKMDIWESIDIMLDFSSYLTAGGRAVMILKLPKRVRFHTIQKALDKLEKGYTIVKARQLFHNRSEMTVLLGRKFHSG